MMGHDADRGIISLTMEKLFSHLEKMEHDHVIDIQASYFEIYNENILDLLRPGESCEMVKKIGDCVVDVRRSRFWRWFFSSYTGTIQFFDCKAKRKRKLSKSEKSGRMC